MDHDMCGISSHEWFGGGLGTDITTCSHRSLMFGVASFAQVAAITVGKDMSIRELQQGAWRMRGLGRGQRCEILLPEEVGVA